MKTRVILFVLPMVLFVACGSSTTTYTISSGTYTVSSATASTTDECGLLAAFQDKQINITVNGATASFYLGNDTSLPVAETPTATINGNALEKLFEVNFTEIKEPDCVYRQQKSVSGSITADDEVELSVAIRVATEAGTCDAERVGVDALPCSSTYHFLAKKQ